MPWLKSLGLLILCTLIALTVYGLFNYLAIKTPIAIGVILAMALIAAIRYTVYEDE